MARKKVSERAFIDSAGNEVDRMEHATGARYSLVKESAPVDGEKQYEAVHMFDRQLGEAGKLATMFAVFGFWTKVGNVVNTVLNDKEAPGTIDDAANEADEWLSGVDGGVWREAVEGGGRLPKYDNGILANVLHTMLGAAAKGDEAHYLAKVTEDKKYRAQITARDDIKDAYRAELVKRGIDVKPTAALDTLA